MDIIDKKVVMFCLGALILVLVIPSVIFAASFDCSKASTKTEKAICADPILSKLDEDMAEAYNEALKSYYHDPAVQRGQRKWLKEVLPQCHEDKVCIKKAYENRLHVLREHIRPEDNNKWLVDVAEMRCDQKANRFKLKYIQSHDDFFSKPDLPKMCQLNESTYKVFGERGPFSLSRCGQEPPISITLTRNGIDIISDTVFGGNCFGGLSIAEVEITEREGRIEIIKLCTFREGKSPVTYTDEFDPDCKYFRGGSEIEKLLPISQAVLYQYTSERKR